MAAHFNLNICLFVISSFKVSTDALSVKEGATYSFAFTKNITLECDLFTWYRHNITIQQCSMSNNYPGRLPLYTCYKMAFTRYTEAQLAIGNTTLTGNLKIVNLTGNISDSDEGEWTLNCTYPNTQTVATFDLRIYKSQDVIMQEGTTYSSLFVIQFNYKCDSFALYRKSEPIQQCYSDNTHFNLLPSYTCLQQPFVRNVDLNIKMDNTSLTGNLTIEDLQRNAPDSDEGLWTLNCTFLKTETVTIFDIKLYQRPQKLKCSATFLESGLMALCGSESVYPPAKLSVQSSVDQHDINDDYETNCQNYIGSSSLYYIFTCNLTISSEHFQIGKIDLNMTVYPNVTSSVKDKDLGYSRKLDLNIEKPEITLKNCSKEGIYEGLTFSCTCIRSDSSDIPTKTIWLINGTESTSSMNISLSLRATAISNVTNYTCIAINLFNWSSIPLMYKPSIIPQKSNDSNSITGSVVGGCVGALVVIVLTSAIILLIRRKHYKCVKKSKKDDTDVTEKLDSIINVLRSLETRQKVLEDKLNSKSDKNETTGDVSKETQYDLIKQQAESVDDIERAYAVDNAHAYQEINLATEKGNYANIA